MKEKINTKELVIDALFIALTFLFTKFINVQLPGTLGGLIHLGNIPLFLGAIIYGKKTGAIAGAFGMGLFDLLSGWIIWAPFTFIICGLMGFAVGKINENKIGVKWNIIGIGVALLIKIIGYYFAEGIIYNNFITPVQSILGNIIQVVLAGIIVVMIGEKIKKRMMKNV